MTVPKRISLALVAVAAVMAAACGGGGGSDAAPATAAAPGTLSISASYQSVPTPVTANDYATAISTAQAQAYGAGARGQVVTYTWSALETAPSVYDPSKFAELNELMQYAQSKALVRYVGIQVINTTANEMPADLQGTDFGSAVVKTRFHALLDQVVGTRRGQIRYLSIGNEVDAYLSVHPQAVAGYKAFYRDAAAYAKTLDPAILVGVTGTGDGAIGANAALLQDLNSAGSDVAMLTYYPVQANADGTVSVRDPSVVQSDFAKLLAFAGSRPLILQEVGYPAGAGAHSSEALQAEFVRQVFAAWLASGQRIPFLNVFLLHDFAPSTCSDFLNYYQLPAGYTDFLCTLGLRRADGTPRAAWSALLNASAQAHLP